MQRVLTGNPQSVKSNGSLLILICNEAVEFVRTCHTHTPTQDLPKVKIRLTLMGCDSKSGTDKKTNTLVICQFVAQPVNLSCQSAQPRINHLMQNDWHFPETAMIHSYKR